MKMVENLLHRSFASVNDEAYRAFLDQRCVSCHASQQSLKERLVLGADCQVCHGPTEAWGDHHYSATWRDKKANRFEGTNMLNTENLASRAKICMSCHVGDLKNPSMEREVDHDLMAAGHPPMHFELETFLRAYPVHWDDKQDAALNGPTAARQRWEIGQLVHAQTRLELLSTRSKSVENLEKAGRVWPELTEYGCYGCHHSLIQPSWRQAQGGRAVYDWDPWSLAGLKLAISDDQQPEMDRLIANLKTTTDSVQASTSASSTHSAAEALLQFINERLRSFNSESPRSVDQIRTELKTHLQGKPDHKSWEAATQWYCMMIANVETLSAREGPKGFSPSSISNQIQTDFLNGPVMYHPMNLDSNRANLEDLLRKAQP